MEWLGLLGSQAVNSWAGGGGEGVSTRWKPKAEFLWVSSTPYFPVSASVKLPLGVFRVSLRQTGAGGAGWATMGDFKIHKYYAVSSWFGSHAKAGGASQNVNFNHNIGR